MKHRVGAGRDQRRDRLAVGDVAGDDREPPVVGQRQRRRRVVEQHQLLDRPARGPAVEQPHRDPPPEKPAPAGDHDAHGLPPLCACRTAAGCLDGLAVEVRGARQRQALDNRLCDLTFVRLIPYFLAQPSPAIVSPLGRYSQPIQPE